MAESAKPEGARADPVAAAILVVEDDTTIRSLLAHALRLEGYDVRAAGSAEEALSACRDWTPQLALVDIRLGPGADGLTLAARLREQGELAVIIVTGSVDIEDLEAGFAAGADMYIEKPFAVEKLLARVHAMLAKGPAPSVKKARVADLTVDVETRRVTRNGKPIHLPPREFDLLFALARRPGRVLTKTQLLDEVWGYGDYDHNVIERRISSLRHKLEQQGPRLVQTVHGVGYTLRP
jgi:two-component system, OmpR family, response regulator